MSQTNYTIDRIKIHHLNLEERRIIERLVAQKKSKAEIARMLCRNRSTITREIRRGSVLQRKRNPYISKKIEQKEYLEYEAYYAETGERRYKENRLNCGAKNRIFNCMELVQFAEQKIFKYKWSPDAVIGYARINNMFESMVSTKTFYNWIESGLIKVKNIDLLLKVKRKQKHKQRQRKKILGKSIDQRPKEVLERLEFGHWEGDGIVGKGRKGHLITLVERKLGHGLSFNVGDRKDDKIVAVLDCLQHRYGKYFSEVFKSITFDNGAEFSRSEEMERDNRTNIYYAHPYSAWERAINENWNGMIRRFIPKGKSFDELTDETLERIVMYINTLPRKRLGYKTPLELWERELAAIMTV